MKKILIFYTVIICLLFSACDSSVDETASTAFDFSYVSYAGESYDAVLEKLGLSAEDVAPFDEYSPYRYRLNKTVTFEGKEFTKYLNFYDVQQKVLAGGGYTLACDVNENILPLLTKIQEEISKEFGEPTTYEGLKNRISTLTDPSVLTSGSGKYVELWEIDAELPYVIRLNFDIHEDMNFIDINCSWKPTK